MPLLGDSTFAIHFHLQAIAKADTPNLIDIDLQKDEGNMQEFSGKLWGTRVGI